MRKTKFRGKRIDTGSWVYGDYFKSPLTDENSGTNPDAGWFFLSGEMRHCIVEDTVAFVVNPETVGQFTGVQDKNGVDIYDGDIIVMHWTEEGTSKPKQVWYDQSIASFRFDNLSFESLFESGFYQPHPSDRLDASGRRNGIEIIGNINDNPHILKNPICEICGHPYSRNLDRCDACI